MKLIKVGAAVLNQTPLDWLGNERRILRAIEAARDERVGVLCLPELAITAHGCEDAFLAPGMQETALEVLLEVAEECKDMAVAIGLPLLYRKALFNVVCLVVDGRIVGFTAKRYLAGDGLYYEPRWFKAWPEGEQGTVEVGGERYPIGDLTYDCGGVRIGFEICEDAWVAERPGSQLASRGVDLILNPSASHFAFGKDRIRRRFVLEGSRAFAAGYVYANMLGNEAGRAIFDGGALITSGGRMLAEGARFSFDELELTTAVIDLERNRMLQSRVGSFQPDTAAAPVEIKAEFDLPDIWLAETEGDDGLLKVPEHEKEEEFTYAICLGLFDYLRKSRSKGFVVSLSGGADSTAVSCLVATMMRLADGELGRERLLRRLRHISALEELTEEADPKELIHRLLLCVYQTTQHSSEETRGAARTVAEALGAEFVELEIESLVQTYSDLISTAVGHELSWEEHDLAMQNIQARVRSPSAWMLANLRGALLLATSNRSEAAVGYATMDGDTSGGLSPIGGIDKAFLRRWLVWMEEHGPQGLAPIPALGAVNSLEPTAELRPADAGQTDEEDLMPYELLDAIERAAIRDKRMPVEVYRVMRARFPRLDREQLAEWVERFFRLWCRNQWKRERYAPSFHVDDQNLDPKTWCRFPILSGGFERELMELSAYVASEG
nr:uncharacterized protein LOC133589514 [Nerophis lumbriciformis]